MTKKTRWKLALAAAFLLVASIFAGAGGSAKPLALSLGWYGDGACDDAEAQNPGDPSGCRYDARERDCGNGIDDDSDERADAADPDCGGYCGDGVCAGGESSRSCDSDCGCPPWSLFDPYTWTCGGRCAPSEVDLDGDCTADYRPWGHACTDGDDNDGDGARDCEDSDCQQAFPSCLGGTCGDGVCGTGESWCARDCVQSCVASAESGVACADGVDNDCDGAVDCADSDCAGSCRAVNAGGASRSGQVTGGYVYSALFPPADSGPQGADPNATTPKAENAGGLGTGAGGDCCICQYQSLDEKYVDGVLVSRNTNPAPHAEVDCDKWLTQNQCQSTNERKQPLTSRQNYVTREIDDVEYQILESVCYEGGDLNVGSSCPNVHVKTYSHGSEKSLKSCVQMAVQVCVQNPDARNVSVGFGVCSAGQDVSSAVAQIEQAMSDMRARGIEPLLSVEMYQAIAAAGSEDIGAKFTVSAGIGGGDDQCSLTLPSCESSIGQDCMHHVSQGSQENPNNYAYCAESETGLICGDDQSNLDQADGVSKMRCDPNFFSLPSEGIRKGHWVRN